MHNDEGIITTLTIARSIVAEVVVYLLIFVRSPDKMDKIVAFAIIDDHSGRIRNG